MTTTISAPPLNEASRAKILKALTHEVHENVDRSIMSAASFASLERYVRFLAVQYLFHHDVAALYEDKGLQALFPDLAARQRLHLVTTDMTDLQLDPPQTMAPAFVSGYAVDLPTALGWLYVAEGSHMGPEDLRQEQAKTGPSDTPATSTL